MKPCLEPGCTGLAPKGTSYCPKHQPTAWGNRPSFKVRYGISLGKWSKIRRRAIRRDGGKCVMCGSTRFLEVDHIVPVSEGGSHELSNLQTLCDNCHRAKTKADRRNKHG